MALLAIFGILSLLGLISYRLGSDDSDKWVPDREKEPLFWAHFGSR